MTEDKDTVNATAEEAVAENSEKEAEVENTEVAEDAAEQTGMDEGACLTAKEESCHHGQNQYAAASAGDTPQVRHQQENAHTREGIDDLSVSDEGWLYGAEAYAHQDGGEEQKNMWEERPVFEAIPRNGDGRRGGVVRGGTQRGFPFFG